ncbi:hypothetical protein KKG83_07400 [Candidatus Micrarchaeota archaeon]|nr:hypothetical protein [Candidatus Micrarchaeota archaeon]MBU2477267.1 hypothetical protein [Candidatus Micrarchaeota archaeon]
MDAKKFLISGILGGIAILIISFIFDSLVGMAFPYDIFSLGGMRSIEDPLMMLFFLSPFVTAFAMSFVFPYLKLEGNYLSKGKKFGFLVWLVAGVPSAFIVYTSMTYPIGFTISSFIGSLLYMLGGAIVIAKFME